MSILEATVTESLFQLINHIYMGQDTRDMADYCLIQQSIWLIQYLAFIPTFISNIWGCFKYFQLDSTFWHLNLTDQLNKSLCKSNQFGANEGRMLGQSGQIPVA